MTVVLELHEPGRTPWPRRRAGDQSLQDIIEHYPPKWDGFLQLRIYLGTANKQAYTLHYPALNIQVTGDTWQAVGGSPVNCASGTSESIGERPAPSTTTAPTTLSSDDVTDDDTPPPVPGHVRWHHPEHRSPSVHERGASLAGPALASDVPAADDASPRRSDLPLLLGIGLAVLVLLAALHDLSAPPPATTGLPMSGQLYSCILQPALQRKATHHEHPPSDAPPSGRSPPRHLGATLVVSTVLVSTLMATGGCDEHGPSVGAGCQPAPRSVG